MATRSGSVDPGLLLWLQEQAGIDPAATWPTRSSTSPGSRASPGTPDMRELLGRDDADARLAFDVYVHRLRAGIGAMAASLGGLDALVFTGGVGEGSARVRELACEGLAHLGVVARQGAQRGGATATPTWAPGGRRGRRARHPGPRGRRDRAPGARRCWSSRLRETTYPQKGTPRMPRARSGRRLASVASAKEIPMYSKIIVGYDGSAQADDALALGKLLAGATGASLTAVAVLQSDPVWGGRDIHFQDFDAEAEGEARTRRPRRRARGTDRDHELSCPWAPRPGRAGSTPTSIVLGSASAWKGRPDPERQRRHQPAARFAVLGRHRSQGLRRPGPRRARRGDGRLRRRGRVEARADRRHRARPRRERAGEAGRRRPALADRLRQGRRRRPGAATSSTKSSTR